ncbi:hypothetical protein pb186bvf_000026 [Paramecium bursaria]
MFQLQINYWIFPNQIHRWPYLNKFNCDHLKQPKQAKQGYIRKNNQL